MIAALLLVLTPADQSFPERTPGMMKDCLDNAVARDAVTVEGADHKYICNGEPAQRLWDWLEAARLPSWEQDVPEGRWLSRSFPLGGCFKRVRGPDGAAPAPGLSCTIWVPAGRGSTAPAPAPPQ